MKDTIKLLFGLLFSVTSLYGTLEAKQLVCDIFVENLKVEGVRQTNTLHSYDVNASCTLVSGHHGDGGNGLPEPFNDKLGPIVVKELPPNGKIEAELEAVKMVYKIADMKLREQCDTKGCNCVDQGCFCGGCSPRPLTAKNSPGDGGRTSLNIKQMDEDIATLKTPILLKNIKNINGIKAAQDAYISKHYKRCLLHGRINMYTIRDSRYIHIVAMHDEDGQVKLVCFDMTDAYKRIGKRSAKVAIRELMERHEPVKK